MPRQSQAAGSLALACESRKPEFGSGRIRSRVIAQGSARRLESRAVNRF